MIEEAQWQMIWKRNKMQNQIAMVHKRAFWIVNREFWTRYRKDVCPLRASLEHIFLIGIQESYKWKNQELKVSFFSTGK
jgi:hypothetical protein